MISYHVNNDDIGMMREYDIYNNELLNDFDINNIDELIGDRQQLDMDLNEIMNEMKYEHISQRSETITKKCKKKKRKKKTNRKNKEEKEGIGYEPGAIYRAQGNLQISKNLTEIIIPNKICEYIDDIYRYMDKITAIHCYDNNIKLLNIDGDNNRLDDNNIMIINYGFHDKENSNKILYCIAEKQDTSNGKARGYKWRLINRLFTDIQIKNEYNISSKELLPKSFRNKLSFKLLLKQEIKIKKLLFCDKDCFDMIQNCNWHRLDIYNRINNKRRMTLSMTKPEFIKCITDYYTKICNHNLINLIPILLFDNDENKYLIEFIWIINIENNINIGIGLRYDSINNRLKVGGIHLDSQYIRNQHQLIDPYHNCHCLDSFQTNISDLKIGNPDDNLNKIKYYKQQITELTLYKEFLKNILKAQPNDRQDIIQDVLQKTNFQQSQQTVSSKWKQ